MGIGKLTEHAENLQVCKKCNLRKPVGNLEMPYGCENGCENALWVFHTHRAFPNFSLVPLGCTFYTPISSGHLIELAFPHIRHCLSVIPSDLMKSTVVDESLSSMNQQFCSRENQLLQLVLMSFDGSNAMKMLVLLKVRCVPSVC